MTPPTQSRHPPELVDSIYAAWKLEKLPIEIMKRLHLQRFQITYREVLECIYLGIRKNYEIEPPEKISNRLVDDWLSPSAYHKDWTSPADYLPTPKGRPS